MGCPECEYDGEMMTVNFEDVFWIEVDELAVCYSKSKRTKYVHKNTDDIEPDMIITSSTGDIIL